MYDILLRNCLVYDGSGREPFRASVAVFDDRIALITTSDLRARKTIDGTGLVLSPGFIDIHSHTDLECLRNPDMHAKLSQGITTDVSGNCGTGVFPYAVPSLKSAVEDVLGRWNDWAWKDYEDYSGYIKERGIGINEAFLVSHTALRRAAMKGSDCRRATEDEIGKMCALLDEALSSGAWGFSTGLYYAPCLFASKEELTALLKVAAERDKLFSVHHRCEGNDVVRSLEEVISLAEETGVRIEISHLKAIGRDNQNKVPVLLSMIEKAHDAGIRIAFDQYPYNFGSTSLFSLLPPDVLSLSRIEQRLALSIDSEREEIKREILSPDGWDSIYQMVGPDDIRIISLEHHEEYSGMSLSEIAEDRKEEPLDALFDILADETGTAVMSDVTESEENLVAIMKHPLMCFGSDSLYSSPVNHPRSYHATVHFLAEYVRDRAAMSLENGIRKLTGEPADRMGFKDRGYIKEGMKADLVLFSIEELGEDGENNKGFHLVTVNGKEAFFNGSFSDSRTGLVL